MHYGLRMSKPMIYSGVKGGLRLDYSAVRNSGMVFEGPGDCLQGPDDGPYIAIHDRAWVEMGRRTGKRCMS